MSELDIQLLEQLVDCDRRNSLPGLKALAEMLTLEDVL